MLLGGLSQPRVLDAEHWQIHRCLVSFFSASSLIDRLESTLVGPD